MLPQGTFRASTAVELELLIVDEVGRRRDAPGPVARWLLREGVSKEVVEAAREQLVIGHLP